MTKKLIQLYTHRERESCFEPGQELGFTVRSDAMDNYARALYEVEFNCELDMETGKVEVKSIDIGDGGELFTR